MWFLLSLFSGVSWSLSDVFGKKLTKSYPVLVTLTYRYIFSIPFLLIYLIFIEIPRINPSFWLVILILLPLELTAATLYLKAITISPLSMVTPFVAFTPVFLLLTSYLILGETVSWGGAIGIVLIAAGAYMINFSRQNYLLPFKKLFQEKGILLMMGVAFLYSMTSNLGKMAMQYSSPSFMGIFYTSLLGFAFVLVAKGKGKKLKPKKFSINFAWIGFFNAIMMITHMVAIKYIQVAYMIAVKRTSLLFGVFFGYLFFHEKEIGKRMIAAIIMLAGVVTILIFS